MGYFSLVLAYIDAALDYLDVLLHYLPLASAYMLWGLLRNSNEGRKFRKQ